MLFFLLGELRRSASHVEVGHGGAHDQSRRWKGRWGRRSLIAVFILLMVVILIPIHALSLLIFLFVLIAPSARG